jgi:aldehyde:ferredoxin oxidoreductase
MFGYHGRYLQIDATAGAGEPVPLPEGVLRRFVGGVGLAAWLLHRECPAGIDPLAPESPLAFVFSPLVGTPLTTSAKFAVAAKSPLTDRFNDALSSSHFALHGKRTGFDALVIAGRAERPSVLLIDDGVVRLNAIDVRSDETVPETTARLKERYGPDWSFGVIGPAGRNLVRVATVSFDNRHAGRGGLGAGLGSKNLIAVGVRGTQRTPVADPAGVVAAARDLSARSFGPATAKYRELGTVANLLAFNRLSALPTRNFQAGHFEGAEAISGEALSAAHRVARASCAACTIGCEHIYRVQRPPVATGGLSSDAAVRLEYESLFALGPLCGISDRDVILRAARRCDDLGLDTISAGATVAFAMECAGRGLVAERGLAFGSGDILLSLLERIARREGLGNLLAEGTRRAAAAIGRDGGQGGPDRLAHPVQVPPRGVRRPVGRKRRTAPHGHRLERDRGGAAHGRPPGSHHEEAFQHPRGVDASRGHPAEAVPDRGVAQRRGPRRRTPRRAAEGNGPGV